MTTYTVDEITVPATMDDDPAVGSVFREWADVQNRAEVATTHLPELLWTPEEQLPYLLDPDAPSRLFLVRDDEGTAVGAGSYDSKRAASSSACCRISSTVRGMVITSGTSRGHAWRGR